MRRIAQAAAALSLAFGVLTTIGSTGAHAATYHGCPDGYVCIYPENAGWNNDTPSHFYFEYGTYNLTDMHGLHRIENNQTGGATMRTCTGYNGTGCEGYLPAQWGITKDLTPINSITLQA
ncbi:hypothetical protein GCM10010515_32920 [Streptomyces fructofermentans]|uniref:Peptidase inhibitor family I36 n=2 Tax=Streptomyces fructofermentans TaxID=152141 RepID=A0A918KHC0_9ACTN|nr:hypothetical protein GCM10010515_32920 [Streptomyces fructofermentans]